VPGLSEAGTNSRRNGHRFVVGDRLELTQDDFGILRGVEGNLGWKGGAFAVVAFRVLGLNFGGIAQDQAGHFNRGGSRKNRPCVSGLGQQGKSAHMIEMGVGQDHRVEFGGGRAQRWHVELPGFAGTLEQAAIDQYFGLLCFHEVA